MKKTTFSKNVSLQTEGKTIPWAIFYDILVWVFTLGRAQQFRNATAKLAGITPGDIILDVGCGTGDLTLAAKSLTGNNGRVTGTDVSAKMIQLAKRKALRKNSEVNFQVVSIENLPFNKEEFDIILCSLMMHHLPDSLKQKGLAECYRVLKPGGHLLVVDLQPTSGGSGLRRLGDFIIHLHGGHSTMQNNLTRQIPFIEKAGFTELQARPVDRQLSSIRATKPIDTHIHKLEKMERSSPSEA